MTLDAYCAAFSRLRRATGPFPEETLRLAPHKPLLLLAVMDLVARGVVRDRFISATGEFTELNELFTDFWHAVMPISQQSSIAFPFARLHNEPAAFWRLVPRPGRSITPAAIAAVTTVVRLRNLALGAEMDEELLHLMRRPPSRLALTAALLASCFSGPARQALMARVELHGEAFRYSRALEEQVRMPVAAERLDPDAYRPEARSQGFRLLVVKTYDHRCALCGTRIVTTEGHTAVDAAHIVPRSESHDDDIRNGMALCKLCHWAFDEGVMGVSVNYTVITSPQISRDQNAAGLLINLRDRDIFKPRATTVWPAQKNLAHHRRRFGLAG